MQKCVGCVHCYDAQKSSGRCNPDAFPSVFKVISVRSDDSEGHEDTVTLAECLHCKQQWQHCVRELGGADGFWVAWNAVQSSKA